MLPVSAWPPGPPGASLSPFGKPRQICIGGNGYVIPKGAWIVKTGGNRVVMYYPPVSTFNPPRSLGTGLLPGAIPPQRSAPTCKCGKCAPPSGPRQFRKFNDEVEAFRAWQRATGNTDPPLRPLPGRRPPNWFGWTFVNAPCSTLLQSGQSGLVVADGQNVVICGGGTAQITQAYSV
jgi:hypothetical protein